ncbi:cyclopropane-fatty-acyl-phospholipid synthase [Xylogone sp. PMI_703]|nr:cyclopropane-fatty-acyl-phospholipid synthase [Xylogone sp. PMI_703]
MFSALLPESISSSIALSGQTLIFSVLRSIRVGRLELTLLYPSCSKEAITFGDASPKAQPVARLTVKDPAVWWQLCGNIDLAMGEAFMSDSIECDDLISLFTYMGSGYSLMQVLPKLRRAIFPSSNTLSAALGNASAHYDTSNDLFRGFLSPDMNYSCALWEDENESLEAAQIRKVHNIIIKAGIKAHHHILDVGCGWGSLSMEAVKLTGCRVTGLTLSIQQKELAEKRIREAGLSDRIEILLCDYRNAPSPEGGYDRIVSVEMIEHVGMAHMRQYFAEIEKRLNKNDGVVVIQGITNVNSFHDNRPEIPNFINYYIFPGGYLPTTHFILDSIHSGSHGSLETRTVQSIGPHYAKTLRLWREKFQANWENEIKPLLLQRKREDRSSKRRGETEKEREMRFEWEMGVFKRKWEYYFSYCEAGFREGVLGDVVVVASREGCRDLMKDVPF